MEVPAPPCCPASEVRDALQHPRDTNFGSKGATASFIMAVPLFDLKVLERACGRRCRTFKSAALDPDRRRPGALQLTRRRAALANLRLSNGSRNGGTVNAGPGLESRHRRRMREP